MIRRLVVYLGVLMVTVGLGLPVSAAQMGSIRIRMDYGKPVDRGAVVLCNVADPVEGGYRLRDVFGGGVIRQEDACSPELAQWLADRRSSYGICRTLSASGDAEFSELERGLYLVVQTEAPQGWSCAAPFLVPIPLDGEWEVLACPKQSVLLTQSPRTGQYPEPLFGAMGLVLSGMGLYFCVEKLRKK